MVLTKLEKYLDVNEATPNRGSGITSTQLKFLKSMGFVDLVKIKSKTGRLPQNPNGFILTQFGKNTVRQATSKSTSLKDVIGESLSELKEVKFLLLDLSKYIINLNSKLTTIENKFTKISSQTQQSPTHRNHLASKQKISGSKLKQILKDSEKRAKPSQKLGILFSTEVYYQALQSLTNRSNNQLNDILFNLFEENILDLQLGQAESNKSRGVRTPSGKTYNWGRVL